MPSKPRDSSPERRMQKSERPERSERIERKESRSQKVDRAEGGDKGEKRERKHRSRTHRSSSAKEKSTSRTSLSSSDSRKRSSAGMPDLVEETTATPDTPALDTNSRASVSYPAFSREHSKEAVGPRPDLHIFTPPSTDVNASKEKLANLNRIINNGPPSPPLTDKNVGRPKPGAARPVTVDTIVEEEKKEDSDSTSTRRLKTRSSRSSAQLRTSRGSASPVSRVQSKKETANGERQETSAERAPSRTVSQSTRTATAPPDDSSSELGTIVSSDATSIAPDQPTTQRPISKIPTPVMEEELQHQVKPSPIESYYRLHTPVDRIQPESVVNTPSSMGGPPPPPPPPHMPTAIPKVDYLLQHGGLYHTVPKNFLYAGKPMAVQQAAMSPGQPAVLVSNLFEPYHQLLVDFERVMSKNGSLAVATGYKSVARRLLDRLEAVFARDLSSEICTCTICRYDNEDRPEDIRGVSWGEILEFVSGRKDLPSWPPFAFVASPTGLGLNVDLQAPMQKLDIDVPEEYREHYIRQSQKTKQSVDRWLNRQTGDDPTSPPSEVDDETLTFAILTHTSSDQRALFKDLLGIVDQPVEPPRRAPSPEHNRPPRPTPTPAPQRVRPDYIIAAGLAIQRLYRLATPPRDPETAIYLLNNPSLHHPLATLAAVSSDEWDILISGRFDGFLRSGAEEDLTPPTGLHGRYTPQMSRLPSRGATPAYGPTQSRSRQDSGSYIYPRPSTAPGPRRSSSSGGDGAVSRSGPIALDEDNEIAALAEIEHDIFVGMEALEDAFEALHRRAEVVQRSLRERSAGLAAAARRRKQSEIEIRAGTPCSQDNMFGGLDGRWEIETDDGLGDDVSELAPDDSASNISSVRKRRHKRRNERRTPVVGAIDEEEESEGPSTRDPSPEKRDR